MNLVLFEISNFIPSSVSWFCHITFVFLTHEPLIKARAAAPVSDDLIAKVEPSAPAD